jgi:hypothetical protein
MRWNQGPGGIIVMGMNSSHCKLIQERILKLRPKITEKYLQYFNGKGKVPRQEDMIKLGKT